MKKLIILFLSLLLIFPVTAYEDASSAKWQSPPVGPLPNGETIPQYHEYVFGGYEQLLAHFGSAATPENSVIQANKSKHSKTCENFIDYLSSHNVLIPTINGKPIESRENCPILFHAYDKIPELWYRLNYNGVYLWIKLYYPADMVDPNMSLMEMFAMFTFSTPTESDIKEIKLRGYTVPAYFKDDTVCFFYKGLCVRFFNIHKDWKDNTHEFWSSFDLC